MTNRTVDQRIEETRADLQKFAEGRPHWKVYDSESHLYAARRFEYANGEQALLSVQFDELSWVAQINLQFAAGPEDGQSDRNLQQLGYWIDRREALLKLPLTLAECSTYAQAKRLLEQVARHELYLLSVIFDVEYVAESDERVHRNLIKKCCTPKVREQMQRSEATR